MVRIVCSRKVEFQCCWCCNVLHKVFFSSLILISLWNFTLHLPPHFLCRRWLKWNRFVYFDRHLAEKYNIQKINNIIWTCFLWNLESNARFMILWMCYFSFQINDNNNNKIHFVRRIWNESETNVRYQRRIKSIERRQRVCQRFPFVNFS